MPGAHVHVVAVKGDVELAEVELLAGALLDEPPEALGDRDAARVDADQGDAVEVDVPLDDLVRDPGQRALDRVLVQQDRWRGRHGRVRHSTPFRPRWTGLKGRYGLECRQTARTE